MTRIRPRRYSAVMNIAATTTTAISPANAPSRVCSTGMPPPSAAGTYGAMSPDPVTVNVPPDRWNPVPGDAPPTASPPHALPGRWPVRLTWSKRAVARVIAPLLL